jgi:anti-sigma-K factor RskA
MTDRLHGGLTCEEVRDLAAGFVLGALPPDEMEAVRAHLAACPEAHHEVAELGGVVPHLAEAVEPVEPPADLRTRILDAAAADRSRNVVAFPVPSRPAAPPARRLSASWVVAAAAVVAIVVLGVWNVSLQSSIEGLAAYREGVEAVLDAAAQPGSQVAVMAPAGEARARGIAAVREDGTVVLAMRDLSPTTGDQVYETWLIADDAAPAPVGGFTVDEDGVATFTSTPGPTGSGTAVALTLEPGPGATVPTLPIVSIGVAQPPPTPAQPA